MCGRRRGGATLSSRVPARSNVNSAPIRFGRFALDIAQRRLLADGVPVTLGSRAFEVLRVLVQSQPRVIGKAELLDLVCPGLGGE